MLEQTSGESKNSARWAWKLPKEGATKASQRRPISLLPMIYRVWAASRSSGSLTGQALWTQRGETPVGKGALTKLSTWLGRGNRLLRK
eukprot:2482704-Amphidinium_carterae.1